MAKTLRNFAALKRTGFITIHDGPKKGPDAAPAITLEFRKRGVIRIVDDVAKVPLLGQAIEKMVDTGLKGAKNGAAAAAEAITAAFTSAADDEGTPYGKVVRDLIVGLPELIVSVVIEDTILEAGESEEDLRDLLRSLGPTALLDLATGWVELNLPEFRDPLLDALANLLRKGRSLSRAKSTSVAAPVVPDDRIDPEPVASEQESPLAA